MKCDSNWKGQPSYTLILNEDYIKRHEFMEYTACSTVIQLLGSSIDQTTGMVVVEYDGGIYIYQV